MRSPGCQFFIGNKLGAGGKADIQKRNIGIVCGSLSSKKVVLCYIDVGDLFNTKEGLIPRSLLRTN